MNLIQQPILIATTPADNSVGMGIMLVMFATIFAGMALRSLSKRARGQWLTFGRSHRPIATRELSDETGNSKGCPSMGCPSVGRPSMGCPSMGCPSN